MTAASVIAQRPDLLALRGLGPRARPRTSDVSAARAHCVGVGAGCFARRWGRLAASGRSSTGPVNDVEPMLSTGDPLRSRPRRPGLRRGVRGIGSTPRPHGVDVVKRPPLELLEVRLLSCQALHLPCRCRALLRSGTARTPVLLGLLPRCLHSEGHEVWRCRQALCVTLCRPNRLHVVCSLPPRRFPRRDR